MTGRATPTRGRRARSLCGRFASQRPALLRQTRRAGTRLVVGQRHERQLMQAHRNTRGETTVHGGLCRRTVCPVIPLCASHGAHRSRRVAAAAMSASSSPAMSGHHGPASSFASASFSPPSAAAAPAALSLPHHLSLFVCRHGERVDQVFGIDWIEQAFRTYKIHGVRRADHRAQSGEHTDRSGAGNSDLCSAARTHRRGIVSASGDG